MISILGVIFLVPSPLWAHGVMGKVDAGGIVVTAQYDTGEAMSYAKVKISAPGTELTGLLPASPVRKGRVEGSYNEMSLFLTGKPRAGARGGFTFRSARTDRNGRFCLFPDAPGDWKVESPPENFRYGSFIFNPNHVSAIRIMQL